jgi:glutamine synthetase
VAKLAIAAMLAAGLKGAEEHYQLPEPVEKDVYEMDEMAQEREGVASLP